MVAIIIFSKKLLIFAAYRFWEAVQELKALPQSEVQEKVGEIWGEYLAPDASCPINVDCQSYDVTKKNMENPDRWSFDCAAVSKFQKYYFPIIKCLFPGSCLPSYEE